MKIHESRPFPWRGALVLLILVLAAIGVWGLRGPRQHLTMRVPGTDQGPDGAGTSGANPVLAGKVSRGDGQPMAVSNSWPQFRGASLDGISQDKTPLARTWGAGEPRELWSIDLGEGYAGAAVHDGRVYVMDYDQTNRQDALRCLSLADGKEIWRYTYPVSVKRFHGMSRTVPAVTDTLVVAIGPKCHVVCADAITGELKWGLDLVRQFGTTVPPWYAGQCPIIDEGLVILAPAGNTNLLMAVEASTGKTVWSSPNPRGWKMTHSSITPVEFEGRKMYVYCADKGVVAVAAKTGELLWDTTAWKISIANVPSPVVLPGGRIFLSGGYNAGSMMLQLKKNGSQITAETAFKLGSEVFGATQHTPISYQDHLYGVRPDGKFTCLDQAGKTVWVSGSGPGFGLGPFMVADGLILAVNDSGLLRLIEASPEKYTLLGQAQILKGRESWGPLALVDGRLIARDLTRMVCLDIGAKRSSSIAKSSEQR